MLQTFDRQEEYFIPGDWRKNLDRWIKNNCLDREPSEYVQHEKLYYSLLAKLSHDLLEEKKFSMSDLIQIQLSNEIKRCGTYGECQQHKQNKEIRYIGYYCNNRSYCLPCAIRYRSGQGMELLNQFVEIIEANDLWGCYSWTFTLPDDVRAWLHRKQDTDTEKKFLLDIRRAIAQTIKEVFGLSVKSRGVLPGFSILYHPVSTGNPFKALPHFHTLILPVLVYYKQKKIVKLDKFANHNKIKEIYKKHLDKVLKKYEQEQLINDKYVVHLWNIDKKNRSSIIHAFKYNNRSQVQDVLKSIKRIDREFESFICLLIDKKEGVLIPEEKTRADIIEALKHVLNTPITIRMSYGFVRVLEKYSEILGIEIDDYEINDIEEWEFLYKIEISKIYKNVYDSKYNKVKPKVFIYIRGPDWQQWQKIDSQELRGEFVSISGRKFFKRKDVG